MYYFSFRAHGGKTINSFYVILHHARHTREARSLQDNLNLRKQIAKNYKIGRGQLGRYTSAEEQKNVYTTSE